MDVLPSQTTYHSVSSNAYYTPSSPNADAHYTPSSHNYSAGHADAKSDAPLFHCFQSEAVPIVDPISTTDGPQWHLREEDYSSLFEEMLAPDPVETLIGDIPSVQLQASIDRTVCNNSYYADNPLVPHCNFEDWDCFQYHNTSVEFSDPSIHWLGELYPSTQPTETPLETEIVNVEVSFTVDDKGVTVPMATGFVLVKSINGKPTARLLKCLFDTGGTKTMASSKILPMGATITPIEGATMCNTIAGNYHPKGKLTCEGLRFPEFDRNLVVDEVECLVFDAPCSYDLILGMDFLVKAGMVINCGSMTVEWQGKTIPMNSTFTKERLAACIDMNYFSDEEDDGIFDSYATSLAESTYERMDVDAVIKENCSHLTESQQKDLRELLIKHERLFDGTLRTYTDKKMDVELLPEASAVYRRPYPVPQIHKEVFRKELERLCEIGVLKRCGPSEWGLPTFLVSKKDGKVRFVSDLRELNKAIKPVNYTLPIISDIVRKRQGYKFMTKLDLSMMFYAIELTERAKELCVISTPFGNFRYERAPMGLRNSPAFAQSIIEDTLRDIEECDVYIDDVGVWSNDWESHVKVLSRLFARLEEKGFAVNPLKCEFGIKESDFLGHWLTPAGVKPWKKKIEAILSLDRPKNASDVRTFTGMINWYRDFWPRRAHLLSPFTKLQSIGTSGNKKEPIVWTDELESCFKEVKAVIARDALLQFPNHNLPFDIYTDASDYQMGACIMQNGKPVAYFSRKLTGPQTRYTTTEKELLAIVCTLNEFRSMLFGAKINIYTDHLNLTYSNFNTQRVLRWRVLLEEFQCNWYYLPGKLNVLADAYSRLPRFDYAGAEERKNELSMEAIPFDPDAPVQPTASMFSSDPYLALVDEEVSQCLNFFVEADGDHASFMNVPSTTQNPLRYHWLFESQNADPQLLQRLVDDPAHFRRRQFGRDEVELVCYYQDPNDDSKYKIALTDDAADATIEFYHLLLNHPGSAALLKSLYLFYHPQLAAKANAYHCDVCQRVKTGGQRGYGLFPPRSVGHLTPWKQVDCDLIGPWYVETSGRSGKAFEFYALTCIDRASGYPDAISIVRKTSSNVANKFNELWLSRYPRPEVCAHDRGGEFIGPEFQRLLFDAGITSAPSTSRNPQSNAIIERLHLSMGNSLRAQLQDNITPRTLEEAKSMMDLAMAHALYAVRTNISEATGFSPGALAFHRDMISNHPVAFDFDTINTIRQLRVDKDIQRINSKRYDYDYKIGQQVMKRFFDFGKLDPRWEGPFVVNQVHVNGNVTIQLKPHVTERVNIRKIKPYKQPTNSVLIRSVES